MPNNMQMKPKRKEPSGFPVAQIFAEVKRRLLDSCGERVMDFFAMLPEHDVIGAITADLRWCIGFFDGKHKDESLMKSY